MQYKIIKATDIALLAEKVNDHLYAGWVLQGGVSGAVAIDQGRETVFYIQAMTKAAI